MTIQQVLPGHRVEFVIAETYGNESYSIQRTVELTRRNISAYIGPQETCDHEARIASVFNLPMISYVSVRKHSSRIHIFVCLNVIIVLNGKLKILYSYYRVVPQKTHKV